MKLHQLFPTNKDQAPSAMDLLRNDVAPHVTVIDKRLVKRRFDRHAHEYDKYIDIQRDMIRLLLDNPVMRAYIELHQRKFEQLQAPAAILDIGCGTGSLTAAILGALPRSTISLLDLSPNMLQQAVAKITSLAGQDCIKDIVAADAELWLMENAYLRYDLILSSAAFQWFNAPQRTLLAASKSLHPGGLLAFTTFLPGTLQELHDCCAAADQYCQYEHTARGQNYPDGSSWTRWLDEACVNMPVTSTEGVSIVRGSAASQLLQTRYWWSEHELTYRYPNVETLLQHIRRVGAGNSLASQSMPVSKKWLHALKHEYLKRYRCGAVEEIQATYRVAVGCVHALSN
ncbi:methyltransferase [Paenibacillus sp. UMB4589-SE434]|uniref:methyltransferase n=1 Tax=Paenibacillus sp. UMB4589-SE434 TaxID=3046314 RepID=UPI002550427B|nr:methyltransferase [Paenibacillus sp. UMB4589-SE434]MDK8182699.1 methyltransferase [Paenibacillus sp. UMB4589-SE434]